LKTVLDEGVPRDLAKMLRAVGCPVDEFPNGWKGMKNGALLALIEEAGFDCLVTCDKSMEWQQSLKNRKIAVLVLPQKLAELALIVEVIADAIGRAKSGVVMRVQKRPIVRR
jgi:hypothetical protein